MTPPGESRTRGFPSPSFDEFGIDRLYLKVSRESTICDSTNLGMGKVFPFGAKYRAPDSSGSSHANVLFSDAEEYRYWAIGTVHVLLKSTKKTLKIVINRIAPNAQIRRPIPTAECHFMFPIVTTIATWVGKAVAHNISESNKNSLPGFDHKATIETAPCNPHMR